MQSTKALSLLQPWASLVVMGLKKVETRSWSTRYRGPLLIHASMGKGGALVAGQPTITQHIPDFKTLPFGCIIGQVTLTDVLRITELGLANEELDKLALEEKAFGNYEPGRFAWILTDPMQFDEYIPATGRLGLWEF